MKLVDIIIASVFSSFLSNQWRIYTGCRKFIIMTHSQDTVLIDSFEVESLYNAITKGCICWYLEIECRVKETKMCYSITFL